MATLYKEQETDYKTEYYKSKKLNHTTHKMLTSQFKCTLKSTDMNHSLQ